MTNDFDSINSHIYVWQLFECFDFICVSWWQCLQIACGFYCYITIFCRRNVGGSILMKIGFVWTLWTHSNTWMCDESCGMRHTTIGRCYFFILADTKEGNFHDQPLLCTHNSRESKPSLWVNSKPFRNRMKPGCTCPTAEAQTIGSQSETDLIALDHSSMHIDDWKDNRTRAIGLSPCQSNLAPNSIHSIDWCIALCPHSCWNLWLLAMTWTKRTTVIVDHNSTTHNRSWLVWIFFGRSVASASTGWKRSQCKANS